MAEKYRLSFSCKDRRGLLATITSFLTQQKAFILESAQYGDLHTNRFFMRAIFEYWDVPLTQEEFAGQFHPIASSLNLTWNYEPEHRKSRVLILVSAHDHCLVDLLNRKKRGSLPIDVLAIASNHPNLQQIAEWHGIPFHYYPMTPQTKESQEQKIYDLIQSEKIDLVILARYMQILSPSFVQKIPGKVINIHHSFLPSFKGAKPYHQAFERGVKIIGATAHYVSDELDEGPIIEQDVIRVDHQESPEKLVEIGKDIEAQVLARAVKYHAERRVFLNGQKTVVFR